MNMLKKYILIVVLLCVSSLTYADVEFTISIPIGSGKAIHWDQRKVQLKSGGVKLKIRTLNDMTLDVGKFEVNNGEAHNRKNEFDIDWTKLYTYKDDFEW